MTKNKQRTANIGFAKWRVQCFYDSLVLGSSSVFQLKFCSENPPLRKAEKRCVQHIFRTDAESFSPIFFRKKFIEIVTEKSCVVIVNRAVLCR